MNQEAIYQHVKQELEPQLTELQQAVLMHEVERYREEVAGHLRHDVQDWIDAVCEQFATEREYIMKKSRKREHVLPRQVIMWGLVVGVVPNKLSLTAIAAIFEKDHATAHHCKKKVYQLLDTDQELREDVIRLVNRFGWRGGFDTETRSFFMQHPAYTLRSAA
jgi:chromosomal replication initiation ATPase DnaA